MVFLQGGEYDRQLTNQDIQPDEHERDCIHFDPLIEEGLPPYAAGMRGWSEILKLWVVEGDFKIVRYFHGVENFFEAEAVH